MRFLHTADWHIGKKLGRLDRIDESRRVLDELVAIARDNQVDGVLVAGDLFDRAMPPFAYLHLVLGTLMRFAENGAHVVVVPGNHDSAELFRVLAPLLVHFKIHVVHKPLEPDGGGIVTFPSRDAGTTARIACLPFIHEVQVIDLMGVHEEGHKSYAERVRKVTNYYADWMLANPEENSVDLLVGHFMVTGALASGSERELHIGEAYMTTADAIPSTIKYAALGHIHLPQDVPGSSVPARYVGSAMQLDFGEAEQPKSVCIVDIEPGMKPAQIRQIPITSGVPLMKVTDTLENLRTRAGKDEFEGAVVDVSVLTDGPSGVLADEVREFLPNALNVRAHYDRSETRFQRREGMSLQELFTEYRTQAFETPPSDDLLAAFNELVDEVGVDW